MKGTAVARRYAKALIDLATRNHTVAETGEELQQHLELLQSNVQLQTLLRNPGVAAEVKTNVLTAILEHRRSGHLTSPVRVNAAGFSRPQGRWPLPRPEPAPLRC